MKWNRPTVWLTVSVAVCAAALSTAACGGAQPEGRNPENSDSGSAPPPVEVGPSGPGTMPGDSTEAGSSSSGGTGTIPPAESPNAPPSEIQK